MRLLIGGDMIKKMVIMLWALALIVGLVGCAVNVPEGRLTAPSSLPPDPFADADVEAREVRSVALGGYIVKPISYDSPLHLIYLQLFQKIGLLNFPLKYI